MSIPQVRRSAVYLRVTPRIESSIEAKRQVPTVPSKLLQHENSLWKST